MACFMLLRPSPHERLSISCRFNAAAQMPSPAGLRRGLPFQPAAAAAASFRRRQQQQVQQPQLVDQQQQQQQAAWAPLPQRQQARCRRGSLQVAASAAGAGALVSAPAAACAALPDRGGRVDPALLDRKPRAAVSRYTPTAQGTTGKCWPQWSRLPSCRSPALTGLLLPAFPPRSCICAAEPRAHPRPEDRGFQGGLLEVPAAAHHPRHHPGVERRHRHRSAGEHGGACRHGTVASVPACLQLQLL